MEPQNRTPKDLFQGTHVYVVPKYQRLYVWNKRDQWEPLWEDVISMASKLLDKGRQRSAEIANADDVGSHFFGAVVLKSSGYSPDMVTRWKVIDGQQRLTTMQLMMAAVADEIDINVQSHLAAPLRGLTSNYPHEKPFAEHHLKIEHCSDNYEGFFEAMDPDSDKKVIRGNMGECYRYFRSTVRDWVEVHSLDAYSSKLAMSSLITVIMVKLNIVGIYLDSHEREHEIFEALNARGKSLTEWDKIKNFLLSSADNEPDVSQDEFFDEYLDKFDQKWWLEEVGKGASARQRRDVFADYWLESKTRTSVEIRRVYRGFQKFFDESSESLRVLSDGMTEDAEYYREYSRIEMNFPPSPEHRFHNRRIWIGIGALWPLIFEVNRILKRFDADSETRGRCFSHLESFIVRRRLVGRNASSYPDLALDLIGEISDHSVNDDNLSAVLQRRLLKHERNGFYWPGDLEVRESVINRRMPVNVQRFVLRAIEASYQAVPSNLEVEHLMPQHWRPHWPLQPDDGIKESTAAELRDNLIHTLGNLTLVNGKLNPKLSDLPWEDKRKLIEKCDKLCMNRWLLKYPYETWDEDAIRSRGEWIADKVCQIWPR